MQKLRILNSKEKKKILCLISDQWGAVFKTDLVILMSSKDRIYLMNREFENIDTSRLRIDSMGLYFGSIEKNGELRLSVEGSQKIGPIATKNVLVMSREQIIELLQGNNLNIDSDDCSGFVIIAHKHDNGTDYYGTAKLKDGILLNFTPKTRRVASSDIPE